MTINEIGKGTTSKVYLEKINGEERAVKIFDKDLPGIFRHREGFFLTLVQGSPFFPKVYEVTPNRIVMEKVAPNIYQAHRQSRSPIGKQDFQIMTRQLLEALDFTDSKAVVHADLKPENISYANGVTKVMDFGLSFFAKEDVFSVIQSSFYRAPEAVFKSSEIDAEADMWSLGCILFEMYTDKVLFESADD
jgi:serine/threonine protein kinase